MVKSMTAYGRGEVQQGDTLFIAEIRSYNNRYRDIILRIPRNYQSLEEEIKSIISNKIRRGRIEVSIQIEDNRGESPYGLELNTPLVHAYFEIFNKLAEQFDLDPNIRIESLCQMKDVILVKPEVVDVEAIRPGLQAVLERTLDSLEQMRQREGEAIEADFLKRLELLEQYVNEIEIRAPSLIQEYRRRLKESVQSLLTDMTVDENRLAQEVAFFAEKSDITEELVRIKSHLKQFRKYLTIEDALGRRLDFLIQEINREVNTVGSKASDPSVGKYVVETKAELEKLREQAQNVE